MTVIKPNPIIQLLIILGPLTGFITMFALLVELLLDGDFQGVYFILVAICILLGLVTCLLLRVVLSSTITVSKQGIRLGSKKFFSWSDVSKVEANMWTGRYALRNPLMILRKIINLSWIHILSCDQMISPKNNNQTTRCANSISYTILFTNSALNST